MADYDSSDYLSFTGNLNDEGAPVYDPATDTMEDYGSTGGDYLGFLPGGTSGFSDILKGLGGLFTGKTAGPLGQLGAFGGLSLLLNKLMGKQNQQPVGYQGGIPKYTYERTQTPMAQQRPAGYRPGQGGISYFTPGRFTPAGYTPKTAEEFLVRPAAPVETPAAPAAQPTETISAASGGSMPGGIAMLAQGRYLRGKGDGVSDSIPAQFAGSGQKALLADGEFVIPARVVSELGNGSSDAGARKLYAMLDRVEARAKKAKRGKPSGADRELNKLA
jgi:hypothetical protein